MIAGGGTGGHVVPSLQIARALVARGHSEETVELCGSRRGQEATIWPGLEFPYVLLSGRGIRRSRAREALWANVVAIVGLAWACVHTLGSFLSRRPRVVVMVGGYASFAAGLAAVLTRVPLVTVSTDAVPSAANRLLARFAAANAVAFEGNGLPRAHVTGTPVRPELHSLDRSPEGKAHGRACLGLPPHRQTVGVMSGSLGALRVNRAVAELAGDWPGGRGRSVYHVTGRRDFEAFAGAGSDADSTSGGTKGDGDGRNPLRADEDGEREGAGEREGEGARRGEGERRGRGGRSGGGGSGEGERLCYRVVPYEERMDQLYTAADVCITRAGAMTVAELLVSGMPAILVPLPGAPADHQTRNAEALARFGAAVVVPDGECDSRRLACELDALFADSQRLQAMSVAASQHGHPDAAQHVAELVDAHAR